MTYWSNLLACDDSESCEIPGRVSTDVSAVTRVDRRYRSVTYPRNSYISIYPIPN